MTAVFAIMPRRMSLSSFGMALRGGPGCSDRFAAKSSYDRLVVVMPPMLFCLFDFVPPGEGRSPRPEEQNFVDHKPRPGFETIAIEH